MDKIERIKAEIERRIKEEISKKESCKRRGMERIMNKISAYKDILSFIESLDTFNP